MKERHTVVERGGGGYTDNSKLINITYTFFVFSKPTGFLSNYVNTFLIL